MQVLVILGVAVVLVACRNGDDEQEDKPDVGVSEEVATAALPLSEVPESESEASAQDTAPELSEESQAPETQVGPEEVTVKAADGLSIAGTFYAGSGPEPWPGVILLHMNGGQRQDWDAFSSQLAGEGYAVLAVDMRGHGQTGGRRDWDQAAGDLQRVWDYLAGRADVDESRTALIGASIGANMALVTAEANPAIQGVVMLSAGRDYFGVTTEDRMVAYGERPVLIVASEEDTEAAIAARTLSDLAQGPAKLEMYEGAGHGTRMFGPLPELGQLIIDWLDEYVRDTSHESFALAPSYPSPTLFNQAWDDREIFRDGLIKAETGALSQLPGASVYHMDLAISPDLQSVGGRLEVRYTNQEDVTLDEVYFHLYPNLLGGRTSVSATTVNGELVEPEYLSSQTVLRLPLESTLVPGESVVVSMDFLVDVPTEGGNNYGVFATIDGVMALAHFYPQVAVYDDDGWAIEVPPENSDVTYANTSFYLVRVTAPAELVLVASGTEVDDQDLGDHQVVTIAAGPARDFYIAASEDYTLTSTQVGETTIKSYGFPEFSEQNELAAGIASGAMESFNERFGPYPYTEFDIAPTPNLALAVEYPGTVVIRSTLYNPLATLGDLPAIVYLEGSVAHEVGHQWFYNVIGNDQVNEPWLDESLTQYVTYLYYVDTYGKENAEGFRQSFFSRWDSIDRAEIPIGQPAGAYSGSEYSAIVYGRGPLFFEALNDEMGSRSFGEFLRDYYQLNKWDIVTGQHLKNLAEEHCDCDLSPLFARWIGDL
jgi:dienelactone hydrolase